MRTLSTIILAAALTACASPSLDAYVPTHAQKFANLFDKQIAACGSTAVPTLSENDEIACSQIRRLETTHLCHLGVVKIHGDVVFEKLANPSIRGAERQMYRVVLRDYLAEAQGNVLQAGKRIDELSALRGCD